MTVLGLTSSFFIQALVDFVFVLGRKPALNWLGLGMLLVTLARVSFLGLRSYLLTHLSQRIDAETVLGYHRHLLGLPLTFFASRRTGEILSRMNGTIRFRAQSGQVTSVTANGQTNSNFNYVVAARSAFKLTTAGAGTLRAGSITVDPASGNDVPVPLVVFTNKPGLATVSQAGIPTNSGTAFRMRRKWVARGSSV